MLDGHWLDGLSAASIARRANRSEATRWLSNQIVVIASPVDNVSHKREG